MLSSKYKSKSVSDNTSPPASPTRSSFQSGITGRLSKLAATCAPNYGGGGSSNRQNQSASAGSSPLTSPRGAVQNDSVSAPAAPVPATSLAAKLTAGFDNHPVPNLARAVLTRNLPRRKYLRSASEKLPEEFVDDGTGRGDVGDVTTASDDAVDASVLFRPRNKILRRIRPTTLPSSRKSANEDSPGSPQASPTAQKQCSGNASGSPLDRSATLAVDRRRINRSLTALPEDAIRNRYRTNSFFGGEVGFLKLSEEDKLSVYKRFMDVHKCYDLIPTSTKVVVFDTELLVKKAFYALVYNGVRAAPLWDSSRQEFVGMLTITDFINILRRYHNSPQGINQQLEEERIATWKTATNEEGTSSPAKFISIDVNESLFDAVTTLCENKVHRLPVMNRLTGNVLYILTHKRILRFLSLYHKDIDTPKYMFMRPQELGIGSWENIKTVTYDTLLIDALAIFIEQRVSALPVVDEEDRVVDIYAKFDAIHLAAEKAYNRLDMPLSEVLRMRNDWFEGVHSCLDTDNLQDVIDSLVKAEVHRMIITDKEKRVKGIISLSDILRFLVLDAPNRSPDQFEESK